MIEQPGDLRLESTELLPGIPAKLSIYIYYVYIYIEIYDVYIYIYIYVYGPPWFGELELCFSSVSYLYIYIMYIACFPRDAGERDP